MITLKVEPYCQDCMHFEADTRKECAYDLFGGPHLVSITVSCEHRDKCKRIHAYLKEKKNETKNTNVSSETV